MRVPDSIGGIAQHMPRQTQLIGHRPAPGQTEPHRIRAREGDRGRDIACHLGRTDSGARGPGRDSQPGNDLRRDVGACLSPAPGGQIRAARRMNGAAAKQVTGDAAVPGPGHVDGDPRQCLLGEGDREVPVAFGDGLDRRVVAEHPCLF